jgi:hypothetical protein
MTHVAFQPLIGNEPSFSSKMLYFIQQQFLIKAQPPPPHPPRPLHRET